MVMVMVMAMDDAAMDDGEPILPIDFGELDG